MQIGKVLKTDEKDQEITATLRSMGLSKFAAVTAACLLAKKETTAREIEKTSGLRQPEVSVAIKQLAELGWIRKKKQKHSRIDTDFAMLSKSAKGRDIYIYSLKVTLDDIINNNSNKLLIH